MLESKYDFIEELAESMSDRAGKPALEPQVFNLLRSAFDGIVNVDNQIPDIFDARREIDELVTDRRAYLDEILSGPPSSPDQPQ